MSKNIDLTISTVHNGSLISSIQGGLYFDNKIYIFADGGGCQVCDKQYNKLYSFTLPVYADSGSRPHCSSVEWIIPGRKVAITTNATGLVNYADRVYVYDISDLSNITQEIVMLACTDKRKYARMASMAYDQTNKIMYIAGYTSGSSKDATSPCWFESFDFSDYIDNGTLSASLIRQTESATAGLHLQDGGFHNGYIYYNCDCGNTAVTSYDGVYLWVLDTDFNTVAVINGNTANTTETEPFFIIPETYGTKFTIGTAASKFYQFNFHKTNAIEDPIKQSVIFRDDNGKILDDNTVSVGTTITVPTPTKEGYLFNGWDKTVVNPITESAVYTATYVVDPGTISKLTLNKSLNVVGYTVNDVEHTEDVIEFTTTGTYTISPIYRTLVEQGETLTAVFDNWDDDFTTEARTVVLSDTNITLTAHGVQETAYLYGLPMVTSTNGISFYAQGTDTKVYLMVSTNTNYPNEYILATNNQFNEDDFDVRTNVTDSQMINYFNTQGIGVGDRFICSVPTGYTKVTMKIYPTDEEPNTPDSRNPQICFVTGSSFTSMHKIYGNTDIYRPIDSSVLTDGVTFDYSAMKIKDKSTNDYTSSMQRYNLAFTRLLGSSSRVNNSIIRLQFSK